MKVAFTIAFYAAVNHFYNHKQQTMKHRNTQNGSKSTKNRSQIMTFWTRLSVKFFFLRGLLRWLTPAKNTTVSWLLNFRVHMFLKSAVYYKIFCSKFLILVNFRFSFVSNSLAHITIRNNNGQIKNKWDKKIRTT